jgi:radical SAM protein with 4Fe4S-binding SPASM domain
MNSASVPVPQPGFELHLTSLGNTLFHAVRGRDLPHDALGMRKYGQWHLNRIVAEYLLRCDGKMTHAEIAATLNVPFRIVADRIASHLVEETGAIVIADAPTPVVAGIFVTGSFDSLAPLHMSVEITDTCNFTCDHCYVSASPTKLARRDRASLLSLLSTLRDNGVKVLEITGGECTTHPDFKEVVAAAAERFHLVAIVSNGYLLGRREGLADWVGSFDNVCVQISIDGNKAFHDNFRKKVGSFDACCDAVRRLKRHGLVVRIAMSVTPENVDQVEEVFLLAKRLGADAFSPAVITTFGRAANLGMCAEKDHELQHKVAKILAPHAKDSLFVADKLTAEWSRQNKEINCGAGWRSFALNGATGEIRSCLFLADSKSFGSVDREGYDNIFASPYISMFKNAPSPSPLLDTCRECAYIATCNGCFAKAFRISETEYPECPWRIKYFPGMSLAPQNPSEQGLVEQPIRFVPTARRTASNCSRAE